MKRKTTHSKEEWRKKLTPKQFKVLLIFRQEQSAEYPGVQVLKDLGYADDIPVPMFMGITGPKGIPDGIMKKIDAAFTQAMKEPAFIKGMKEDIHYPIVYRNRKEITDYVVRNYEFFRKYLKEVGIAKY
jgi:tripartite-type tricarboxylate transporter receptor subunit TctC